MGNLENHAVSAINYVRETCDKIGPRYSGSEQEKDCALDLKKRLTEFSDEIICEEFPVIPDLYPQGLVTIAVVTVLCTAWTIVLKFPFNLISLFGPIFGLFVFTASLIFMKDWFGFFFKKKQSYNVLGKIFPQNSEENENTGIESQTDTQERKKVIIAGHIDSANFMKVSELGDKIAIVTFGGLGWVLFTMLLSIIKSIWLNVSHNIVIIEQKILVFTYLDAIWVITAFIGIPLLIYLKVAYTGKDVVLGANDNLISVGIAMEVGKYFASKDHRLKNIEVWIGGFGSEECGERGSEYFVKIHGSKGELENAHAVIPESCGAGSHLAILKKEKMHFANHDTELCDQVLAAYKRFKDKNPDLTIKPCEIKDLPYSASDAGRFSLKGYSATTILGYEGAIMKPTNWHSLDDTPECLEKDNVRDIIGICVELIKKIDTNSK